MRSPCDTCAFREGSCTHDEEPYNAIRALICALAGIPFFCHHGLNWERHISVMKGIAFDLDGNSQQATACAGWQAETRRLSGTGQFSVGKHERFEQKWWGNYALQLVDAFCDPEANEEDKAEYIVEIQAVITSLIQRRPLL